MYIVFNCLGMPFHGDTLKEKSLGGSETAQIYLAKELAAKGHKVSVFTNMEEPANQEGIYDDVKYIWAGNRTENAPFGERFHFYAENTPHDVLVIQRQPHAFRFNYASKVNIWWVHDLPLKRNMGEISAQMWNIDCIWTVSEYHKKTYADIYGINPEIIMPIQNGVDLSLYETKDGIDAIHERHIDVVQRKGVKLLYTSRPERGLEHLVGPGGIMERLSKIPEASNVHLYFCGYDNVTDQMRPYYENLWARAAALPNVTNLGSLTKKELADVMRQCDVLTYPTPSSIQPDFNEVSCITAMECMAAGLPMITTNRGALPETTESSGTILVDVNEDDSFNMDNFFDALIGFIKMSNEDKEAAKQAQLKAAKKFSWDKASDMAEAHIETCFKTYRSDNAIARELMRNSDIYALEKYVYPDINGKSTTQDTIEYNVKKEMSQCYEFAFKNTFYDHYKAYYQYEKDRGVNYGPENLDNNTRFESVSSRISDIIDGAIILDYGCAHGHYTINLAKRFPNKSFIGFDITESNIETARQWAKDDGVKNVKFYQAFIDDDGELQFPERKGDSPLKNVEFDAIIAAEVLEHVADPKLYVSTLNELLKPETGLMIITTPYGPWEAEGYKEHYPWRAHLWHLDRADLSDLWGHFPNFDIKNAPSGSGKTGQLMGSYITSWNKPEINKQGDIDYTRKFNLIKPMQTISLCMIIKDAESTLKRCLDSVKDIVSEIILAIDETTTDRTKQVIEQWVRDNKYIWPIVKTLDIKSPMEIGFDAARNLSIDEAHGDWILWMDSDEVLTHPQNIYKYLRSNHFHGYAIPQHHYAVEPAGLLKTDLPVRLFRNNRDVRFYGVVHEHPEKVMNDGVGFIQLISDVNIAHQGYITEDVRRKRFDRNIPLLMKDREKYPDRKLGKFLWIRDLAQMCQFELEYNGGKITPAMIERADEGLKLWEELLEANELRMLVDGIDFYSMLSKVKGDGFDFGFKMDSSKLNGGVHLDRAKPVVAHFANKQHMIKFLNALANEKVKDYEERYF